MKKIKKNLVYSAVLLTALFATLSCAQNQSQENKNISVKEDPILEEIGSALPQDKESRVKFLTSTLTEKRARLLQAQRALSKSSSETEKLEVEILDNEILLLEAEMYGLQEGLELAPSEL